MQTVGKPEEIEINLVAYYSVVTGWVHVERTVEFCLDFSKAFDAVFHNIPIGKLRKSGTDERTVRWTENSLTDRAQSVVICDAESSWKPVDSSVPKASVVGLVCLTSSSVTWMK